MSCAGDGRMSYTDLGKSTGLSTSAVHQRVRRLEQRGSDRQQFARHALREAIAPIAQAPDHISAYALIVM